MREEAFPQAAARRARAGRCVRGAGPPAGAFPSVCGPNEGWIVRSVRSAGSWRGGRAERSERAERRPRRDGGWVGGAQPRWAVEAMALPQLETRAASLFEPFWAPPSRRIQKGPRVKLQGPGFCVSAAGGARSLDKRSGLVGTPHLFPASCGGRRRIFSAAALLTTYPWPARSQLRQKGVNEGLLMTPSPLHRLRGGAPGTLGWPPEVDPESSGSPRVFHFHFSLLNIGHCLQVFTQAREEVSPQVQKTHARTRWIPDNAQPQAGAHPTKPLQGDPHIDFGYVQQPAIGTPGDSPAHLSGYGPPTLGTPPATLP